MEYPKGTTKEQWDRYESDLLNHKANCLDKMPYLADTLKDCLEDLVRMIQKSFVDADPEKYSIVINARKKLREYEAWSMMRSMDEPNKPGYHRANND